MRCYICDWSPTGGDSLYHETLELNHYTDFRNELGLPYHPAGLGSGTISLMFDNQDRPICSKCSFGEQNLVYAELGELELPEPANDNLPPPIEEVA